MAYTLQWPNTVLERRESVFVQRQLRDINTMSYHYKGKIKSLSPAICLQADVLYPNAWAAINNTGVNTDLSSTEETFAVGCVGHQIDNEFPLQSRVPIALPLLQYPTNTRGISTEEQDMCAIPVLNWEKYIQDFRFYTSRDIGILPRQIFRRRFAKRQKLNQTETIAENLNSIGSSLQECFDVNGDNQSSEEILEELDSEADEETQLEESFHSKRRKNLNKTGSNYLSEQTDSIRKAVQKLKKGKKKKKRMTAIQMKKALYCNEVDLEANEKDKVDVVDWISSGSNVMTVESNSKKKLPEIDISVRERNPYGRDKIPLKTFRKYKDQPNLKVMGTWNFLYGGNGACDWFYDYENIARRQILVGNGTKLRMVSLKPTNSISMLSFVVDSVWEEDDVPTNIRADKEEKDDMLSDLIFKIVVHRKRCASNLVSVQRGRSVEIYRLDGIPSRLTSIPNICYGTKKYMAGPKACTLNPLIVSFDVNSYQPSQIVTLDQNNVLRFVDYVAGRTTKQFLGERVIYKTKKAGIKQKYAHIYPEFSLNESAGVIYGNHPSTFYQWYDSQIYFHDQRIRMDTSTNHIEILSLRSATSSMSWSDQQCFMHKPKLLNEFVSNVKPSLNSTYYYVGTSSRVLLMDMRVPGNPVLKMSHGMKSPASYVDTYKDENYEVLVAGSQRIPQIFCAVHDYSHLSCIERSECMARNPILQSYPRHLSNSRDFFEFANGPNLGFSWECDYRRAKDHCYGWTTGLCVMPSTYGSDPRKPPGIIVMNGNSFGDIFYQELDQKPLQISRTTELGSRKLEQFISGWTKAMTPTSFNTFRRPSQNRYAPTNCDLIIDANAEALKYSAKMRKNPFDPFTPHGLIYNRVSQGLKSVEEQIQPLKTLDGPLAKILLKPWTHTEDADAAEMSLGQEFQEEDEQHEISNESIEGILNIKQEEDNFEIEESEVYNESVEIYNGSMEVRDQPSRNIVIDIDNSDQDIFEDENRSIPFEDTKFDEEESVHITEESEVYNESVEIYNGSMEVRGQSSRNNVIHTDNSDQDICEDENRSIHFEDTKFDEEESVHITEESEVYNESVEIYNGSMEVRGQSSRNNVIHTDNSDQDICEDENRNIPFEDTKFDEEESVHITEREDSIPLDIIPAEEFEVHKEDLQGEGDSATIDNLEESGMEDQTEENIVYIFGDDDIEYHDSEEAAENAFVIEQNRLAMMTMTSNSETQNEDYLSVNTQFEPTSFAMENCNFPITFVVPHPGNGLDQNFILYDSEIDESACNTNVIDARNYGSSCPETQDCTVEELKYENKEDPLPCGSQTMIWVPETEKYKSDEDSSSSS